MEIKSNNILIEELSKEATPVSLKWIRGASRYNNGATKYGRTYLLRVIMGCAGQRKLKEKTEQLK